MADQDETYQNPDTGDDPAEGEEGRQAADPHEAELAALRAEVAKAATERDQYQRQLITTLAQQRQQAQPVAAPLHRDVEPDYDSIAERVGMSADQFKAVVAASDAKHARELEDLKQSVRSLQPSWDDRIEALAEKYNVDKYEVIGVCYRASDQLGGTPSEKQIVRKAEEELKARKPAAEPESRTAGTGGGSLPPGRRAAGTEKKLPSLVDIIKADQRKKGYYAY